MIDKIKKNKVLELPDWVSNQMKEIIKWMMNNNENHRPTTKMILSHDTVLMYLRSCESHKQLQQDNINALKERDQINEERIQDRIENYRVILERNGLQSDSERAFAERDRERIEKDRLQIELNRQIQERNGFQSDNERALAERDRERIEKDRLTEIQRLQAETSKLRPQTTSSNQQSKSEPKVQQIQQQVPPSLNPNMLVGIIPDIEDAYQQGIKIIRTDKYGPSTIAFDPIISNGIVRFGGFFERHSNIYNFMIGIADSSAVFGSNEGPRSGENDQKTVCYWSG
ncbi:MAG: hypothetical protein EZS28_042322, partial [Streblomastix strix]